MSTKPWDNAGETATLVDSLSRHYIRIRAAGFALPWTCACGVENSESFGACMMCKIPNEQWEVAVATDSAVDPLEHVLLSLARVSGSRAVEAVYANCLATKLQGDDPMASMQHWATSSALRTPSLLATPPWVHSSSSPS